MAGDHQLAEDLLQEALVMVGEVRGADAPRSSGTQGS
jgi:hypothetical protein